MHQHLVSLLNITALGKVEVTVHAAGSTLDEKLNASVSSIRMESRELLDSFRSSMLSGQAGAEAVATRLETLVRKAHGDAATLSTQVSLQKTKM